jgi:hypothetical protein
MDHAVPRLLSNFGRKLAMVKRFSQVTTSAHADG